MSLHDAPSPFYDAGDLRIISTGYALGGLTEESFRFPVGRAALVLAFLPPDMPSEGVSKAIQAVAGGVPVIALPQELGCVGCGQDNVLNQRILLQIYSPDLIAQAGFDDMRAAVTREVEGHFAEDVRGLHVALELIADGFALYDSRDRLVRSNARYRSFYSGGEEIIQVGRTFSDIVGALADLGAYGDDREAVSSFLANRLGEHRHPTGRGVLHQLQGGRWLLNKEFRTQDGGVVATRSDITELKLREEELERLQQRYQLILESAGDGIIGLNGAGHITFANGVAVRLLGLEEEEGWRGAPYEMLLHDPEDRGLFPAFPLVRDHRTLGEARFRNGQSAEDGSDPGFVAEFSLTPMCETHCDGHSVRDGAVLVFRDISLRKAYEAGLADHQRQLECQVAERTAKLSEEIKRRGVTERALRDSQGRLLSITASLFEGVLLVDLSGIVIFANPSARRWLEDEALAERELDQIFTLLQGGEEVLFHEGPFAQVIQTGETILVEDAVFLTNGGKSLNVAFATSPLVEAGRRRMAIISFRSIEALKQAQLEALQASRLASVGQLAAGIAHEINTPIHYVGANLRFMADSLTQIGEAMGKMKALLEQSGREEEVQTIYADHDLDYLWEELPGAASQSLEGVEHVAHIVRSMKEFSHPGSRSMVATDLNRTIDSTLTVSRNEWKHVAEVETDLDPTMPLILCFPADMAQVLLNLIVNAAQSIESGPRKGLGKIRVSTRMLPGFAEIRVEDNGPGVPPAVRDKIFDPFFTTKAVGKGTGQGLSICLDVVCNRHGGRLFLDESVWDGACFVIRLPIKAPEEEHTPMTLAEPEVGEAK